MRQFLYNGEDDYVPMLRFLAKCRMEKTSGIVVIAGEEFHVSNKGRFFEKVPPIVHEVKSLLADLVRRH